MYRFTNKFCRKQMLTHEARHLKHGDRPLQCDLCDKGFVREKELTDHRRMHHEGKKNR